MIDCGDVVSLTYLIFSQPSSAWKFRLQTFQMPYEVVKIADSDQVEEAVSPSTPEAREIRSARL